MTANDAAKKKKIESGRPQEDDPLLRSQKSIQDKVIGSEDTPLSQKRLAAIKRSREMSSESDEESGETSPSPSTNQSSLKSGRHRWIQLGPTWHPNGQTYSDARVNVSGRITAIVIDPSNTDTIYVGAAQGGVWKSTNGGKNWIPTSDDAFSLAIGALAIDENDSMVLYAGTGEANFGGDSQYGLGLIKTTNGAKSWKAKGIDESSILDAPSGIVGFLGSRFSRLAINPRNSSMILAATVASDRPTVASGIYRSTDGGEKWKRMGNGLPPVNTVGATDVIIDPSNSDVAYAAFFGDGVYKTTNLNASDPHWTKLTLGVPSGSFNRIVLGISRSSPNTIYALLSNPNYVIDKFFTSSDGGSSWNSIPLPNGNIGGQGFYNINIAINPKDKNTVYLSGISLWKAVYDPSTNKWNISDIGKRIHPDNHAFAFNPDNPEIIYAGCDGGIYRSTDAGRSWDDSINLGLSITQFEFMDQHPTSDKIILAGTQDNGTLRYDGEEKFYHSDDGDGGYVCIDPNQPKNMWHTYYSLSPAFSDNGGDYGSWQDLGETIFNDPSEFYPPLTLDKSNPNNVAIGGKKLYLDPSQGRNRWPERIDLNLGPPEWNFITTINYVNSNLIYVGTGVGHVYSLIKQGNTWRIKAIHSPPLPSRYLWDVATLPNDDKKVVVPISGFGTGHLFRGDIQSDGTSRWTHIGEGLPDNPANAIVMDDDNPDKMYVGMDVGVFSTTDGGKHWKKLGKGLPNVQIYDMRLHQPTKLLKVATHGRGLWQLKVD
jgi:photosystem II stability/assembly factor-like uncharacterized protein